MEYSLRQDMYRDKSGEEKEKLKYYEKPDPTLTERV